MDHYIDCVTFDYTVPAKYLLFIQFVLKLFPPAFMLCYLQLITIFSPAAAMPRLDEVITNLVDVFLEYSGDEQTKISREAMKNVLDQETQSPEFRVRQI